MADFTIQPCQPGDSHYQAVGDLVESLGQTEYFTYDADWHLEMHILVAVAAGRPVGVLNFAVQEIGSDCNRPGMTQDGETLREAYVLAFGVAEDQRRHGVGTALQNELIRLATTLGCHQVRSRSAGNRLANHALKLSLGFGVHPTKANDDAVFFVLPLPKNPDASARH